MKKQISFLLLGAALSLSAPSVVWAAGSTSGTNSNTEGTSGTSDLGTTSGTSSNTGSNSGMGGSSTNSTHRSTQQKYLEACRKEGKVGGDLRTCVDQKNQGGATGGSTNSGSAPGGPSSGT